MRTLILTGLGLFTFLLAVVVVLDRRAHVGHPAAGAPDEVQKPSAA